MKCSRCGAEIVKPENTCATGYATTDKGETVCYQCCAVEDEQYMTDNGRNLLYLSGREVTNWPGTLRFPVSRQRQSRHNIGRTRTDVWFVGPDKAVWHGVNIGDNQILRCKRTQRTAIPNR